MDTLQLADLSGTLAYWLPTIIAIAAAALISTYFYLKSRRTKQPAYAVTARNLIQSASTMLGGIKVTFKDLPVDNLSVARVVIWNAGTETINGSDIAPADPLRIFINDGTILDETIVRASASSQFRINKARGDSLQINFDYLDHDQGGLVQFVHTGSSGDEIKVLGSIKGCSSIAIRTPGPNRRLKGLASAFLNAIGLAVVFGSTTVLYSGTNLLWSTVIFTAGVVVLLLGLWKGLSMLARRVGTVPAAFEPV